MRLILMMCVVLMAAWWMKSISHPIKYENGYIELSDNALAELRGKVKITCRGECLVDYYPWFFQKAWLVAKDLSSDNPQPSEINLNRLNVNITPRFMPWFIWDKRTQELIFESRERPR